MGLLRKGLGKDVFFFFVLAGGGGGFVLFCRSDRRMAFFSGERHALTSLA